MTDEQILQKLNDFQSKWKGRPIPISFDEIMIFLEELAIDHNALFSLDPERFAARKKNYVTKAKKMFAETYLGFEGKDPEAIKKYWKVIALFRKYY